ncbi:uncharacterized protein FTJAE_10123 [Fusarium tjaetaba]|uniref:Uncharacterized protein n=1 Tax=Fusarium tjaetaba TaxID=1567544 RepID=A0A8H5VIY5_9HYPO|nr:uncharacterized protein FTJAE_10123 [Fusarium tjaetaba]KAF5625156.1 hypothetical protein FTJAE_10123 [Fusarium tjaetaba]
MPVSSFPTDSFCKAAEAIFRDASHQSIVPRHFIRSYFEAECDASRLKILDSIINYFQDPAPGKRRETFIVSPFNDSINFLVRYGANSHERSLTVLGTSDVIRNVPAWLVELIDVIFCAMRLRIFSFRPKGFSWFLDQQRLGHTLLTQLGRFVHFGTDPSDNGSLSRFPAVEDIRNNGFWNFRGRMSRSQLNGGGLGLVDCSESTVDDQLADDEGEGSQAQPRSLPSIRRSSRLKRRRVDYNEVSDIDMDLPAKSSSHEDEGDLYSDGEKESDQSSGAQSETAEFSSQENNIPDACVKAPVKARSTPLVPTFTEADLIFPLTQPEELKLLVLFAASIQVAQLQTLVYYSREEASYCLATSAIDWASVSIVAEGLTPNDLKGLYAPEVCRQLFESDESAEIRRKALLGPNCERLRGVSSFEGEQPREADPFGFNDSPNTNGRVLGAALRASSPNVLACARLWETSILTSASVVVVAKTALQERCLAREETLEETTNARTATPEDQDCGNFSHDKRGTCQIVRANAESALRQRFPAFGLRCPGLAKSAVVSERVPAKTSPIRNHKRRARCVGAITPISSTKANAARDAQRALPWRCKTEDEADVEDNESSEHGAEDADEDSECWD